MIQQHLNVRILVTSKIQRTEAVVNKARDFYLFTNKEITILSTQITILLSQHKATLD